MRKPLGTGTLLLLGTIFTTAPLAQTPAAKPANAVFSAPSTGSCPVGFSARHAGTGAMVNVSPTSRPPAPAYSIRFIPGNAQGIVEAKVTLHGLSGREVVPASKRTSEAIDATESFTLAPSAHPHHLFTSVVYPGKLTGVTAVELNEIAYADGTRWHEAAASPCQVVPDGYMLVAGR